MLYFFSEFDLLEIRLNELYPYVDYFVIVESTLTYSGERKTLYYKNNAYRYRKFRNKIIHIVVNDMPNTKESNISRRIPESYQRNQIGKGLLRCNKNDIILVSDLDEIPNPNKFGEMIILLNLLHKILTFQQTLYYYYINGFISNSWFGTTCCKFSTYVKFLQSSAQKLRRSGSRDLTNKGNIINNGGWHFSYLGGVDKIIKKISCLADEEYHKKKYKNRDVILRRIEKGQDIFNRRYSVKYKKIDNNYPRFLLENISKYKHLIKKC